MKPNSVHPAVLAVLLEALHIPQWVVEEAELAPLGRGDLFPRHWKVKDRPAAVQARLPPGQKMLAVTIWTTGRLRLEADVVVVPGTHNYYEVREIGVRPTSQDRSTIYLEVWWVPSLEPAPFPQVA